MPGGHLRLHGRRVGRRTGVTFASASRLGWQPCVRGRIGSCATRSSSGRVQSCAPESQMARKLGGDWPSAIGSQAYREMPGAGSVLNVT
jgi:hypothetical protein